MIRSAKTTIKYTNTEKLNQIRQFIDEYKIVTQTFIDYLWDLPKISRLIPKEITSKVDSWISQRAIQACAKQASGIVRGTKKKFKQRQYQYDLLLKEGKTKQARRLKKVIDKNPISKPNIKTICPELDSRFVEIEFNNNTSFDGWITLKCLGNKLKINVPFKKNKHFNYMLSKGQLKQGIRLSYNSITFNFELPDIPKKTDGETIGADIGVNKVFVTSNNQIGGKDKDGWNLEKIQTRLSNRKKGSKGFKRTQEHRENFVNWSLNQLNLSNVKTLRLENIKNIRRGKRSSRYMSHWTYTDINRKLESLCEESGVQILRVNPAYTSQRCSRCGWVSEANRNGESFKCKACSYACDADYNGSMNISFVLPAISRKRLSKHLNKKGFYLTLNGEPIVPHA